MGKRFWFCGMVLSLAAMVLDFLVHGLLLRADYAGLIAQGLVRGEADGMRYLPWMLLAHAFIGFGLTWLYCLLYRGRTSLRHGLRFGAAVALAATIPGYLIYHAVQPWPLALTLKQILLGTSVTLLLGLLLAWLEPRRVVL